MIKLLQAKQKGDDDDDLGDDRSSIITSNDKLIQQQLENNGFTVFLCVDQASDGGSRVERARCYPVVLDIPRDIADAMNVEANFFRVRQNCRIEQFPFESFTLPAKFLDRLAVDFDGSRAVRERFTDEIGNDRNQGHSD